MEGEDWEMTIDFTLFYPGNVIYVGQLKRDTEKFHGIGLLVCEDRVIIKLNVDFNSIFLYHKRILVAREA